MRMCTLGHHRVITETNKTTNFRARFFYNMFLYWLVYYTDGTIFCITCHACADTQILTRCNFGVHQLL